jgi:hypothetical protein
MPKLLRIILVLVPVIIASTTYAGIYIWVDENGVKHYTDTPPPEVLRDKSKTQLREIVKSQSYKTIIFKVVDIPDPSFLGSYFPIKPTAKGFPQYELETEGQGNKRRIPKLDVYSIHGKWMWRLIRGRDKYFSAHVREGTPANRVRIWKSFKPNGPRATVRIETEAFVTTRAYRKYHYDYDLSSDDENALEWMKKSYRVSGHPDAGYNGIYKPVNWSSLLPRYKYGQDMCLAASGFAESWEWNLGKCEKYEYTADIEPKSTMPDKVRRWYQRKGMLYLTFKIAEVETVSN